MRVHRRSRCARRLRTPLVMCLGLAVSLSAALAQDEPTLGAQPSRLDVNVQKLAQVNTAQMVPPAPRAGPASRPGEVLRPFPSTEPLRPGARPFQGTEPLLQERPGSRRSSTPNLSSRSNRVEGGCAKERCGDQERVEVLSCTAAPRKSCS
jgi:hypothetical protein